MPFIRPRRLGFAPPGQLSLNRAHPLVRGMSDCLVWNCLAPPNLAASNADVTITGAPTLAQTARGFSGVAGLAPNWYFSVPNHGNIVAGDFTIRVLFRPVVWNGGGFDTLFGKSSGATRELSVFFGPTGNVTFVDVGNSSDGVGGTTGMTANGSIYDYVMARSGTTVSHYVDSAFKFSAVMAGTTAQAFPMRFGKDDTGSGTQANAQYITVQIWTGRALSAAEIRQLYQSPFCFLNNPPPRVGIATSPPPVTATLYSLINVG